MGLHPISLELAAAPADAAVDVPVDSQEGVSSGESAATVTSQATAVDVVAAPGETLAWCTCQKSENMPRCDGSHKALWTHPLPPKE